MATSTSLLALVQSEVSSHKATSSPESPSNVSPELWRLKLAYMTPNNGRHSGLSRFHLVTLRKQQIKTIKTQIHVAT
jgi:hypothetical protein